MTLQQLRYFLALCEKRSFSKAAYHCGVSQPTLSNSIRALEVELGGSLFSRRPRGSLTRLGNSIYPVVQSAVLMLEALTDVAARQRSTASRVVNIPPPKTKLSFNYNFEHNGQVLALLPGKLILRSNRGKQVKRISIAKPAKKQLRKNPYS